MKLRKAAAIISGRVLAPAAAGIPKCGASDFPVTVPKNAWCGVLATSIPTIRYSEDPLICQQFSTNFRIA
jgi:hypothetical protein